LIFSILLLFLAGSVFTSHNLSLALSHGDSVFVPRSLLDQSVSRVVLLGELNVILEGLSPQIERK
jgi:hypothetical protein